MITRIIKKNKLRNKNSFVEPDEIFLDSENLTQNNGLDNVLELSKTILESEITNTRILMQFDLNDIPVIPATATASYFLNLFVSRLERKVPMQNSLGLPR